MIQIAGIAAVCLLLTVLLRKENPTFALLVTVAGAGLLFYTVSAHWAAISAAMTKAEAVE